MGNCLPEPPRVGNWLLPRMFVEAVQPFYATGASARGAKTGSITVGQRTRGPRRRGSLPDRQCFADSVSPRAAGAAEEGRR